MTPYESFRAECAQEIQLQGGDGELAALTRAWMNAANRRKYSYHFEWLGRPIIQYPQDIVAIQQLIWALQPDLIVETGIAHGGSLVLSASMLALLDLRDAIENGEALRPGASRRKVLGVDIDIRSHNRAAIEAHPFGSWIHMVEGSSVALATIEEVHEFAAPFGRVLVCLDSNHTEEHVLAELDAYAPLVSQGSYCVVFDTVVEHLAKAMFPDRPWGPGNNPMTAVKRFLREHPEFENDHMIEQQLLITVAPGGYLRRKA